MKNEYIKVNCSLSYCDEKVIIDKEVLKEIESKDERVYCSNEHRYEDETGHPGEEY